MTTAASLIAVGPVLATAPDTVSRSLQDAFSTSLLWAERVTTTTVTDPASPAYFDGVRTELANVAWNVTDASYTTYDHDGTDGTPAAALKSIVAAQMPASATAPLDALLDEIAAGSPGGMLGNFLTTWWAKVGTSATSTVFSTSPLTLDANGQLTTTLAFLDFGTRATDWQSFFVSRLSRSTSIRLSTVEMTLNLAIWQAIARKIETKLGEAALGDIARIDL